MKIHDVVQLSPEWFELRRGLLTASEFHRLITPKTMKPAADSNNLITELIAEVYHPGPLSELSAQPSRAMQHGLDTEDEARNFYALVRNLDVREVGLVVTDDGRFGSSPDGLIAPDPAAGKVEVRYEGCLEMKCPTSKVHVGYVREGVLPAEYRAQCHGHMIVTGLDWCDFLSYCVGFPPLLLRVERDEFTTKLEDCLEAFWPKYQAALADFAKRT